MVVTKRKTESYEKYKKTKGYWFFPTKVFNKRLSYILKNDMSFDYLENLRF